jgi:hypothetical protein
VKCVDTILHDGRVYVTLETLAGETPALTTQEQGKRFDMPVLKEFQKSEREMIMSFICSCRNKKSEPIFMYTFRKVRTMRGCLEGLDDVVYWYLIQ